MRPASSPGRRPRRRRRTRASGSSAPAAPAGGTRPAPRTPRHPRPAPGTADRLSPSCAPSTRTTSCLRPVYTPPGGRTGRPAGAQFPRAAVYALPTAPATRPPDRAAASWKRPWKADDGIARTGRARSARRSQSPPRPPMTARAAGTHGTPAHRRNHVSRTPARVLAGWRTGLPGPVLVLQAGTAVSYFGTGLILPFEIIYLHQARGLPTATAGLALAAVMGTAAVVTPPSGALLDRFRAKPILITGNLASALGYAGFAFADHPGQAFACADPRDRHPGRDRPAVEPGQRRSSRRPCGRGGRPRYQHRLRPHWPAIRDHRSGQNGQAVVQRNTSARRHRPQHPAGRRHHRRVPARR